MLRVLLLFVGLFFPSLAFAEGTEIGEVENFGDFISQIWAWATQVIFGISVIMLIIGGIMYMAAGGEEDRIDAAKQVVKGTLISTFLTLFSAVLFTVLQKPTAGIDGAASLGDTAEVLENITSILLGIVGAVSVLALIYNGLQYMLSVGDLDKINGAKRGLKLSLLGLMLSLLAYFLVGFVLSVWT